MIILGIDPGTARMGYGVVDFNKKTKAMKLLETNCFITVPELEMPKRLKFIYNSLKDVLKKYSPEVMVVEKLFFNTNVRTAMAVGQARGVVMLAAADSNVLFYEYTALEAKKVVADYGRASKKEMQTAVQNILKLDAPIKSDDANDAVAMVLCFIKKDLEHLW